MTLSSNDEPELKTVPGLADGGRAASRCSVFSVQNPPPPKNWVWQTASLDKLTKRNTEFHDKINQLLASQYMVEKDNNELSDKIDQLQEHIDTLNISQYVEENLLSSSHKAQVVENQRASDKNFNQGFWCCLCAPSLRTRYLFCEAAAEETPALAMAEEKPKEGVKTENNDHINLKVAGQDGSVVQFKIKRHTPLSKLMKAYCERQGLSMRQVRFRFDGQPINETDTSAQVEMEDEDTIDVFQQQTGGVY
ncbi:small ubiquitin-related modifier 2-like protein [Cricetulus griseus]|uniref:Small ubiquitin-related modifier 2 n=2 Tax=Cricetulus griseus TaxID=10029 RepID=A0A061I253_CRIGR|nr:small ubiquitin-related modifier 2-like protein [Cricetulus griseus]